MLPLEIMPIDLKTRLSAGEAIVLLDCREVMENQMARIEPSTLIPMNTIPANLQQVEAMAEDNLVVVYCHHGMRSLNTVQWLRQKGVENVTSLSGGIERWSVEVDAGVPRY